MVSTLAGWLGKSDRLVSTLCSALMPQFHLDGKVIKSVVAVECNGVNQHSGLLATQTAEHRVQASHSCLEEQVHQATEHPTVIGQQTSPTDGHVPLHLTPWASRHPSDSHNLTCTYPSLSAVPRM